MRFVTGCSLLFVIAISPIAIANSLPTLIVQDDNGAVALKVEALHIDVMIRGHLARTTYEITYRNTLDRDVDGDFAFPLPADAEVSDIALYFGDHLRHGVAVERAQARTAYEATVHRRADPALAEWSSSSRAFHFRVFPIPRQGTKVVHIAYDQELTSSPYELDLRYGATVNNFDLTIDGDARIDAGDLPLRRSGDASSIHMKNAKLDGVVHATPPDDETALLAYSPSEKVWFASARLHVLSTARTIEPASDITLLYDASGSGVQRDAAKLRDFLDAFLAKQASDARVTIVPFHIALEAARESDAQGLDRALATIPLAGATNLAAALESIPSIRASSRVVIVTDGVNNIGDGSRVARAIGAIRRPITIVNASSTADDNLLGNLARTSGGWYIDLAHADPVASAESVMRIPSRIEISAGLPMIRDLLPSSILATTDTITIVNTRSRDRGVTLPIIAGNVRHEPVVRQLESDDELDLVRRAWARAKLRALLDSGAAPEVVLAHGRHFNQLTPRTSLIVLETWQDYEMWGIPLPRDLREQRDTDLAPQPPGPPSTMELRGTTNERPAGAPVWFMKGSVTLGGNPLPGATLTLVGPHSLVSVTVSDMNGTFWITANSVPSSFTLKAEMEGLNTVTQSYAHGAPKGSVVEVAMRLANVAEAITVTASAPMVPGADANVAQARNTSLAYRNAEALADKLLGSLADNGGAPIEDEQLAATTIAERVLRINAVIEKLRSLNSIDDRYRYYASARSVLGGEKLFQARAALAMRDDAPDLAIRMLTDLIEANPDDAPTLRIIGRVLVAWGRIDLATPVFERALELAPGETQTWRELLLLHAQEGHDKELAELQKRYEGYHRDERMYQTDTALAEEMKRRRTGVDPRIDPSAEVQIEAMWDTNWTDVDMHVIEPGGEEVFYGHRNSAHGGLLHDDVTTGFGPEIYTIPHAEKGTYQVVLQTYAEDRTRVTQETLAHVIVWSRGERHDFFVALTLRDDKRVVATVNVD